MVGVTHIETAPHEVEGNLIFCDHGLSPYWALGKLCIGAFEGYSGDLEVGVDGEEWTINLGYQEGGNSPPSGGQCGP